MSDRNTIARAFELARSGAYKSVSHIRNRLKSEGFDNIDAHLDGGQIKRQLLMLMKP